MKNSCQHDDIGFLGSKEGIGMIDFIWADVQGAEADILLAVKKLLGTRAIFTRNIAIQSFTKGKLISTSC